MSLFNDRESAFEAKFAHDEELRFLARALRDKLFAHWAGDLLGVTGDEVEALTRSALAVPEGQVHDERLIAEIARVLAAHGRDITRGELLAQLELCAAEARSRLLADPAIV